MQSLDNHLKTPLSPALTQAIQAAIDRKMQMTGRIWPASVAAVVSPGIVTVNFEVNAGTAALTQMTMPLICPAYMRFPTQVGDKGLVIGADAYIDNISGLGSPTPPDLTQPMNLSAMSFIWLGNANWETPDPEATVMMDSTGTNFIQLNPGGALITGANPNLFVDGNLGAGNGASGQFTTPTGQTVTVTNGIITNIY